MAGKFAAEFAFGFLPQSAEGIFSPTLDAIAGTWSYTQGLLLGDPESGVGQSGLSLKLGRRRRDKAFHAGSFTRSLSDFLSAEVSTLEVVVPFCGHRANASNPPVDADAIPLLGIDALLQGAGLVGGAWGSGVGHRYAFGSTQPISALVYYSGNRLELLDCRAALSIEYTPGGIALLTATIEVGSVKEHSAAALPTLTYGSQASVSAPTVAGIGFQWQEVRGPTELTLEITPAFEEFGDMNAATGFVQEASDREVKLSGKIFADDTASKIYDWTQLVATAEGTLDPISFTVGAAMTALNPVLAHRIVAPLPELVDDGPDATGTKAASSFEAILRGASANAELELIFL